MVMYNSSNSSSIGIRPIRPFTDREALHDIWTRAFELEPSVRWLYHIPNTAGPSSLNDGGTCTFNDEQDTISSLKQAYTNHLYLSPSNHIFFAHDTTTGEVVGMAAWEAPLTSAYAKHLRRPLSLVERLQASWHVVKDNVINTIHTYLPASLLPYFSYKMRIHHILHEKKIRWMKLQQSFRTDHIAPADKERDYWTLAYLGVLPSYGRRGIGQQLLQWGLERADEEDRSIYISASVQGVGLYRKIGAEVLESRICMEGEEMGGWTETWMCRARLSSRKGA